MTSILILDQAISFARFNDGRRCNETCESTNPCFPIAVPTSDPRIRNHQCLGFTRSSATCNTDSTSLFFNTVSPRQQLNSLTSYIDASNVYGSTDRMASIVRDLASNRGLLREGNMLKYTLTILLVFVAGNICKAYFIWS